MQGTGASSAFAASYGAESEHLHDDMCATEPRQPIAVARVGEGRLGHSFMDSLIDLLEVIELDMHHKGEHRLAIYAKTLRGTYLARRLTSRSHA